MALHRPANGASVRFDLDDPRAVRHDHSGRSPAVLSLLPTVVLGRSVIDRLENRMRDTGAATLRACLHTRSDAALHDMLVFVARRASAAPHKHERKDETYHLVRGTGLLLLFDDGGRLTSAERLDVDGSLLARVGAGQFHTLVPTSDCLVFHESRPGPFEPGGDSLFAPWAPPPADADRGCAWLERLVTDHSK